MKLSFLQDLTALPGKNEIPSDDVIKQKKALMNSAVNLIQRDTDSNIATVNAYKTIVQDAFIKNKGPLQSIQQLPKDEQVEALKLLAARTELVLRAALEVAKQAAKENKAGFKAVNETTPSNRKGYTNGGK